MSQYDNNDLDIQKEQRNSQRLRAIYDKRERAAQQLMQTFPGDQGDEELLFRAVKAYFYEMEWIIKNDEDTEHYLNDHELGAVTKSDVREHIDDGSVAGNSDALVHIGGLWDYIELGPTFGVPVLQNGSSRSSGYQRVEVGVTVPARISEKAFRALNSAMNDLSLDLKPREGRPMRDFRDSLDDDEYRFEEVHHDGA